MTAATIVRGFRSRSKHTSGEAQGATVALVTASLTSREHTHRQRGSVGSASLFLAALVAAWPAQIKNREWQSVVWTKIKLTWVFP